MGSEMCIRDRDEALANDRKQTAQTLLKLGAKKGKLIAIDSDDQ